MKILTNVAFLVAFCAFLNDVNCADDAVLNKVIRVEDFREEQSDKILDDMFDYLDDGPDVDIPKEDVNETEGNTKDESSGASTGGYVRPDSHIPAFIINPPTSRSSRQPTRRRTRPPTRQSTSPPTSRPTRPPTYASGTPTRCPVLRFSCKFMPNVCANIRNGIRFGRPRRLNRITNALQIRRNKEVSCGYRYSCNAYPFASSRQGGRGAIARWVPARENSIQGWVLAAFYRRHRIGNGGCFIVMV